RRHNQPTGGSEHYGGRMLPCIPGSDLAQLPRGRKLEEMQLIVIIRHHRNKWGGGVDRYINRRFPRRPAPNLARHPVGQNLERRHIAVPIRYSEVLAAGAAPQRFGLPLGGHTPEYSCHVSGGSMRVVYKYTVIPLPQHIEVTTVGGARHSSR